MILNFYLTVDISNQTFNKGDYCQVQKKLHFLKLSERKTTIPQELVLLVQFSSTKRENQPYHWQKEYMAICDAY